jgi:hypothetical protein
MIRNQTTNQSLPRNEGTTAMRLPLLIPFIALTVNSAGHFAQQTNAQDKQEAKPAKEAATTNPEQEILKKWVGNWDATIESTGKDGKSVTNAAKATVKLAYGGRWLITDFDGTFNGAPFSGQEVVGYDTVDKKYLLNWIDSAATSFSTGEGSFDQKSNTMTYSVTTRDDSTGKMTTWRQVDIWKDADHHEWSIRTTSPDGKENIQMTIRYVRKS